MSTIFLIHESQIEAPRYFLIPEEEVLPSVLRNAIVRVAGYFVNAAENDELSEAQSAAKYKAYTLVQYAAHRSDDLTPENLVADWELDESANFLEALGKVRGILRPFEVTQSIHMRYLQTEGLRVVIFGEYA